MGKNATHRRLHGRGEIQGGTATTGSCQPGKPGREITGCHVVLLGDPRERSKRFRSSTLMHGHQQTRRLIDQRPTFKCTTQPRDLYCVDMVHNLSKVQIRRTCGPLRAGFSQSSRLAARQAGCGRAIRALSSGRVRVTRCGYIRNGEPSPSKGTCDVRRSSRRATRGIAYTASRTAPPELPAGPPRRDTSRRSRCLRR